MRLLIPTDTKFIAGARAYRLWVETDTEHPRVHEVLNANIRNGRRVIVPETRFAATKPVEIEDYQDGHIAAQTGKTENTAGLRISSDFDDAEIDAEVGRGGPRHEPGPT